MNSTVTRRGVYFMANDRHLELTIAFLNSFRLYNPEIPLCLIPFDQDYTHLTNLSGEYNFIIFSDLSLLESCDRISLQFHDCVTGHYRKLAAWNGCFNEFAYIDVDTVVLRNIDFAFEFLSEYDFLTSHSHIAANRKWVWKDSILAAQVLTQQQIAFAANTGFFVSRAHLLTIEYVKERLHEALEVSQHMELFCAEQPFLNYLMVTYSKRYSSLSALRQYKGRSDLPIERWAGEWYGVVHKGRIISPETPEVFLVHWAGVWRKADHETSSLWRFYRYFRSTRKDLL